MLRNIWAMSRHSGRRVTGGLVELTCRGGRGCRRTAFLPANSFLPSIGKYAAKLSGWSVGVSVFVCVCRGGATSSALCWTLIKLFNMPSVQRVATFVMIAAAHTHTHSYTSSVLLFYINKYTQHACAHTHTYLLKCSTLSKQCWKAQQESWALAVR